MYFSSVSVRRGGWRVGEELSNVKAPSSSEIYRFAVSFGKCVHEITDLYCMQGAKRFEFCFPVTVIVNVQV